MCVSRAKGNFSKAFPTEYQGQWEKYPFYVVNDQLPYGHGEKSVYIISKVGGLQPLQELFGTGAGDILTVDFQEPWEG